MPIIQQNSMPNISQGDQRDPMVEGPALLRCGTTTRREFLGSLRALGMGWAVAVVWAESAGGATSELAMVGIAQPVPGRGITKVLEEYQKQHSVKVNYQFLPSERFVALFTAAQSSNQEIDVIFLTGQDTRRYMSSGAILPLDTLITYKDRFLPKAVETFTINGHLWGVPIGAVAGFPLLVNKKLLDDVGASLPTTYDELLSINRELGKKGVSTFTHPGKNIYFWPVWFFTTYAQVTGNQSEQKTVELLTSGGSFTDPEVVEALDLIFRFARDGMFSPTSSARTPIARCTTSYGAGGFLDGLRRLHRSHPPGQPLKYGPQRAADATAGQ